MKKNLLLVTAAVGLVVIAGGVYSAVQRTDPVPEQFTEDQLNEGGVDDIADLTLPEAKKRLNYLIEDTRSTQASLAQLESLQLRISPASTSADASGPKELQYEAPFMPLTRDGVKAELALLKQQPSQFTQLFFTDGAQLKLNTETLTALFKRAIPPDDELLEQYKVQTVTFRDGTEQPYTAVQGKNEDTQSDSSQASLTVSKPVEKIELTMTFNSYPGFEKQVLDARHSAIEGEKGASYKLAPLEDSTATLLLSLPKGAHYVVQGLSKDGKPLRNTGQSSSTLLTPKQRAALQRFYDQLVQARQDFSQWRTSAELQKQLQAYVADVQADDDSDAQSIQAHYFFEDTPNSVVIYVLDPVQAQQVAWEMTNEQPAQERYIGYDRRNEKAGFLDSQGQWLVKPRYEEIDYTEAPDIYRVVVGKKASRDGWTQLISQYMSFLPGTRELKALPFEIIEKKVSDDLLMVERETNGPYGLYDIKKRQVVVPMKYVNAEVSGDYFIARVGEKTYGTDSLYGIYSLSGKELLAPRYSNIEVRDGLIYTTAEDREHVDVLDNSLKKLNAPGSKVLGGFVAGQPLLIEELNSKAFHFIDVQGKTLPWSLPYDEVQPFSNGMAVVTRDHKSGAIDTTGTLRVPLKYEVINPFQKNLAAAELEGVEGLVLIDKKGAVVKKLGSPTQYSVGANSNDATYSISSGESSVIVYDADGNPIDQSD